jgi:thiol-disulfide isomerase/thioredoxin
MASLREWLEDKRAEGPGRLPALLLVAAGLGLLGWLGMQVFGSGTPSVVGRNLGSLRLRDADGRTRSLGELAGRVVVVDLWATWCPPCRMSLPELAALQARQGADYAVVPVSLDRGGFGDITPFFKANPALAVAAEVPDDPGRLAKDVGKIEAIPTTLILDRRGKVVRAWVGFSSGRLEAELKEALAR